MFSSIQLIQGAIKTIGALYCLRTLAHYVSVLGLFVKPSRIARYLHTTDGKPAWALITGGSGAIGQQMAHELAGLGFNIVLHGRNQEKLDAAKADLARSYPGRQFRTLIIDASQSFGAADTSASWLAPFGDINLTVLINNAGGSTERKVAALDELSADRLVTDASVNSMFPILLMQQAIPLLRRSSPGLIINIGSLADVGLPLAGSYSASKASLAIMTEALAREMRCKGRDIEVLGVKAGNVYGTPQGISAKKDLFSPDAPSMAKAVIARVGCGRKVVVGHWRHTLQWELFQILPSFVLENMLTNITGGWEMDAEKVVEKKKT